MDEKENKLEGASTDFYYIWDEVYGWIHISEKEKLKEAYKRFIKKQKIIITSTPRMPDSFFEKLWFQSSFQRVNENVD